ncbi:MAG: hypothetical protein FJX72_17620 [Armatimonadetes bacterium]|nr:hypothetical protein [Armatimonadota bacterium]
MAYLDRCATETGRVLWDVVRDPNPAPGLSARAAAAVRTFGELIADLAAVAATASVSDLTREVILRTGYAEYVDARGAAEQRDRAENVRELLTVTARFDEMDEEDRSLARFLEQVALVSDLDEQDMSRSAVTLMTLHSSKGLEFDTVFLAGMEQGLFPHSRSLPDDREMEEERRLCYVGITRAKQRLVATYAYRRTLFGMTTNSPPSQFLREMGALPATAARPPARPTHRDTQTMWDRPSKDSAPAVAASPPTAFRAGDKVSHPTFGIGIVLSARPSSDEAELTVAFPNKGAVKLMESYVTRVKR